MYTELAVVVGVVLAIVGNVGYFRSVWRREISPHPVTWFVGSIVSAVTFFGAVVKGGGIGVWPILASEIFTILIFLFSLRLALHTGFKNVRKIDLVFLLICILGIIPWYLTNDPTISVITVVVIDVISFIPTILKTWHKPLSENPLLYLCNASRHIIILFTLASINIATSLHSFTMIIINTMMIAVIYKNFFRKKL
jgi:hypothetical protein